MHISLTKIYETVSRAVCSCFRDLREGLRSLFVSSFLQHHSLFVVPEVSVFKASSIKVVRLRRGHRRRGFRGKFLVCFEFGGCRLFLWLISSRFAVVVGCFDEFVFEFVVVADYIVAGFFAPVVTAVIFPSLFEFPCVLLDVYSSFGVSLCFAGCLFEVGSVVRVDVVQEVVGRVAVVEAGFRGFMLLYVKVVVHMVVV